MDECVPLKLLRLLTGHTFTTAVDKGWGGFTNGRLITLAEPEFDLFLTADRNLEYQQNPSRTSRVGRLPSCFCPPITGRL